MEDSDSAGRDLRHPQNHEQAARHKFRDCVHKGGQPTTLQVPLKPLKPFSTEVRIECSRASEARGGESELEPDNQTLVAPVAACCLNSFLCGAGSSFGVSPART